MVVVLYTPDAGSSPGGWGEGERRDVRAPRRRFIPRRLGRGMMPPLLRGNWTVHPQAAGERANLDPGGGEGFGSSPGGWGEGPRARCRDVDGRFIPRRLGRGARRCGPSRWSPVHPQAAGERVRDMTGADSPYGSSPGGWGEGRRRRSARRPSRFIPRRLGRGSCSPAPSRRTPVHPQAAGERGSPGRLSQPYRGSSPGGWGEAHGR